MGLGSLQETVVNKHRSSLHHCCLKVKTIMQSESHILATSRAWLLTSLGPSSSEMKWNTVEKCAVVQWFYISNCAWKSGTSWFQKISTNTHTHTHSGLWLRCRDCIVEWLQWEKNSVTSQLYVMVPQSQSLLSSALCFHLFSFFSLLSPLLLSSTPLFPSTLH